MSRIFVIGAKRVLNVVNVCDLIDANCFKPKVVLLSVFFVLLV